MQMDENTTDYGPDYEKYGKKIVLQLHSEGIDAAGEPEIVNERAEAMAEKLVLDEELLKNAAHEYAPEGTLAGNIYEDSN